MTSPSPTIAFVVPCVGKKPAAPYPRSWLMEPLAMAVLSSLTPPSYDKVLYDDRVESIPYDAPVDLAALTVETYTARRAYQIAAEFRRRRIPVVMAQFARHGIAIYGTFVFGYDHDTPASIRRAQEFASRHRLFFAAFNHLVPFPGTPIYRRLSAERRLPRDDWWLAPDYRFGDIAFTPALMTATDLANACLEARRAFYSWPGILSRALNTRCNTRSLFMAATFLASNAMSRTEVDQRQGLPLGV
jgi:hypothetical protein